MSLSRRDRAALQLAYEWLRDLGGADPWDAGTMAVVMEEASSAMAWLHWMEPFRDRLDEINEEGADRVPDYRWMNCETRLLRARLALAIRAMLRADRGDFGARDSGMWLEQPHECGYSCAMDCGETVDRYRPIPWPGAYTHRITPLWQIAPKTGQAKRRGYQPAPTPASPALQQAGSAKEADPDRDTTEVGRP